jgi:hypothetical protein
VYSSTDYRLFVHLRAFRRGSKKIVVDLRSGRKQVYDLSADPTESRSVQKEDRVSTYEMEQGAYAVMQRDGERPTDFLGGRAAGPQTY